MVGFKTYLNKGWLKKRYIIIIKAVTNQNLDKLAMSNQEKLVKKAKNVWKMLKKALILASILIYSDFSKFFKLYIDRLKKHRFGTVIYQI